MKESLINVKKALIGLVVMSEDLEKMLEKYFELLEIKPDIEEIENPIGDNLVGDIEFSGVKFQYPVRKKSHTGKDEEVKSEMVLKGLSFKIKRGQKVAFVGESGSGKSTIANLIRRAFDPQEGEILINGHNLKELDLKKFLKLKLHTQGEHHAIRFVDHRRRSH